MHTHWDESQLFHAICILPNTNTTLNITNTTHTTYNYEYIWRKDNVASAHTLRWLPASSGCLWDTSQQLTRAVKRRLSLRWESRSLPSYSNLGDKQTPEQGLSLFHIAWYLLVFWGGLRIRMQNRSEWKDSAFEIVHTERIVLIFATYTCFPGLQMQVTRWCIGRYMLHMCAIAQLCINRKEIIHRASRQQGEGITECSATCKIQKHNTPCSTCAMWAEDAMIKDMLSTTIYQKHITTTMQDKKNYERKCCKQQIIFWHSKSIKKYKKNINYFCRLLTGKFDLKFYPSIICRTRLIIAWPLICHIAWQINGNISMKLDPTDIGWS